ncbi:MAG: hypothetical protein A3F18_08380 [Legionellales bacterium RIFCSPHIGHO2_12_FULL_37_14]|nr:MAG: hypothetical protein A3F18_08380 [Legionellales bacterium RIFCSPHIGHO2_12_FULL_37_14]
MDKFTAKLKNFISSIEIPSVELKNAIDYVIFPGGKRLRPQLVYLTGDLLKISHELLDPIAIAIELMHTYSLVHDDLPAMDNDDLRRGKPTCHKVFGEAIAILVGDALQSIAITALTSFPQTTSPQKCLNIMALLAKATGPSGMISGQALDLKMLTQENTLTQKELENIHNLKTTALIKACIESVLEFAEEKSFTKTSELLNYATSLGLAFQMQDDYLDLYDPTSIGKNRSSDACNQKQTFSAFFDKTSLLTKIQGTFNNARDCLAIFGADSKRLVTFTNSLQRV